MDGAKGNGANAQEYDFKRWFNTIQENEGIKAGYDADCMLFGAEAYTTVRWIGNELGIAGKDTWSKSTVDKEKNTINSNKQEMRQLVLKMETSGPFRKQMLVLLLVGSGEQQRIHQRQWTN